VASCILWAADSAKERMILKNSRENQNMSQPEKDAAVCKVNEALNSK